MKQQVCSTSGRSHRSGAGCRAGLCCDRAAPRYRRGLCGPPVAGTAQKQPHLGQPSRRPIPGPRSVLALFEQQKPVQGRPLQFLFGAAVAVLIIPIVACRVRILFHHNLEVRARAFVAALHVHQNAEQVAYFVGNLL